MTRRAVYGSGLLLTIICTIMTIASITTPRWVEFSPNDKREITLGLHKRCTAGVDTCTSFPRDTYCMAGRKTFCNLWRTVGFLIDFAVVVELATLVSFGVIISGGVQRRSAGWKIVASLLVFSGVVQCVGIAIVAYIVNNFPLFSPKGWSLSGSWSLSTASFAVLVLTALAIALSALYLPEEGGYELIPNYQMEVEQNDEQLQSRIAGWNDGFRPRRGDDGDAESAVYSYQGDDRD